MYVGKKRSEEIDGYITKREGKRERNREKQRRKRERETKRGICGEIYLCDPRTLFVVPLSKDEALEAFAQTAAS